MNIGIDIVAIARIEAILKRSYKQRFLAKFLSDEEQQLSANNLNTIAGFWAAKEAVAKALQCGIGEELSFLDIHLKKSEKKAPYFELSPAIKKRFNAEQTTLSIAHDSGFAIAVALVI